MAIEVNFYFFIVSSCMKLNRQFIYGKVEMDKEMKKIV